ncbi:MAG: hypothetical protein ACU83N_01195 [Gammaproteobacteria bacterium]
MNNDRVWYYQSIDDAIDNDDDALVLWVMLSKVRGHQGIFSNRPDAVTYDANGMNLN